MSTIFLDPIQMDATAGHIGGHVRELTPLADDLQSACSAQVPAALAGWLAEELRVIVVHIRMVALLYTVAALDTAQRAQQIQADQSLAVAAPSLTSTAPVFAEVPLVGGVTAFASSAVGAGFSTGAPLVGGIAPFATSTAATGFLAGSSIPSALVYEGMPAVTYGPPAGFVLGAVTPSSYVPFSGQQQGFMLGNGGPSFTLGGATGSSGSGSGSFLDRLLLSTPGRTHIGNNVYTGSGMTGSFSEVLPDPDSDY